MGVSFLVHRARKTLESSSANTVQDLSQLIGAIGETRTNVHHEGTIFVNGELWSARSTSSHS
jgi:membrane-bound ClpP family serine protease